MIEIRVAQYAPFPGGRYRRDGPYSGEWFRQDVLTPAIRNAREGGDTLNVWLDDVPGYGASFLEEAFGGLVRHGIVARHEIDRIVKVRARDSVFLSFAALAKKYMEDAQPGADAAA